jgi:endonuclease/exonuclease/phosphatase family metal-dependent hydrolase
VGDFNIQESLVDRSSRQKATKNFRTKWHYRSNGLKDINRKFYPAATEYTFISASHGNFYKIDHILGHKSSLNTYKKIKITSCILSDHNGIKPEVNSKRNYRKYSNILTLNNTLLNDQCIPEEIKGEIKKFLEVKENRNTK